MAEETTSSDVSAARREAHAALLGKITEALGIADRASLSLSARASVLLILAKAYRAVEGGPQPASDAK